MRIFGHKEPKRSRYERWLACGHCTWCSADQWQHKTHCRFNPYDGFDIPASYWPYSHPLDYSGMEFKINKINVYKDKSAAELDQCIRDSERLKELKKKQLSVPVPELWYEAWRALQPEEHKIFTCFGRTPQQILKAIDFFEASVVAKKSAAEIINDALKVTSIMPIMEKSEMIIIELSHAEFAKLANEHRIRSDSEYIIDKGYKFIDKDCKPKVSNLLHLKQFHDYDGDNIGDVRLESHPEGVCLWIGGVIVYKTWESGGLKLHPGKGEKSAVDFTIKAAAEPEENRQALIAQTSEACLKWLTCIHQGYNTNWYITELKKVIAKW